ncbi:MAG: hypothetical protein K2W79_08550, partial [Hydrotalea flava]|nr:hypothetical protein [Hydrotalea flava]
MKNILKIKLVTRVVKPAILCLSMAVIVSGCSKNFLEVPVQGQQPATQIWKTATDAANAVNAIYGNLRSWN